MPHVEGQCSIGETPGFIQKQADMIIKHESKTSVGRVFSNFTNLIKDKVLINNTYRNEHKNTECLKTALKAKLDVLQKEGKISEKKLNKILIKWNIQTETETDKKIENIGEKLLNELDAGIIKEREKEGVFFGFATEKKNDKKQFTEILNRYDTAINNKINELKKDLETEKNKFMIDTTKEDIIKLEKFSEDLKTRKKRKVKTLEIFRFQ